MNSYFGLLFCFLSALLSAQESNLSVQIAQSPGMLIKHTRKMNFNPTGLSQFTELNLTFHTKGKRAWESYYHLPRLGLGLRYLDLGKPSEILGTGYAFFPFIDFGFFQKQQSSFRFMIGCGLAYLNQTYQIKGNPSQTAIGSHWNNLTTFQFKYEHSLYKTHFLSAGVTLSHISNGSFKAPNLGLNFVSVTFGYAYHFKSSELSFSSDSSAKSAFLSAFPFDSSASSAFPSAFPSALSWMLEYGMTLKEGKIPGGPKFLIQWYMLDFGYQYNEYKSWRFGVELENNQLDAYSASYSEIRENKKAAAPEGRRYNFYLAHQWLFGDVGLTFRTGYELKSIHSNTYPIATKLDLCYIMPFQLMTSVRPYIGFSLKAHLDTAEYIGAMAGFHFYKMKSVATESISFTK